MKHNYKIGDRVKIYSYNELLKKIHNGMTIKSTRFKLFDKFHTSIFALSEQTYDNISDGVIIKSLLDDCFLFKYKNINNFYLPYEFIKPDFSLPDELFKI